MNELASDYCVLHNGERKLVCCCSIDKLCPTLCDPMDCSTPGFPVLHYLPEFVQSHVCWVDDAIQPSHPLSLLSLPALSLSQHQGLFHWVSSLHQVAKVLEFQFQHQSFQWMFKGDLLQDWLVWSPCSQRDSPEYCHEPQFKNVLLTCFLRVMSHGCYCFALSCVPTTCAGVYL